MREGYDGDDLYIMVEDEFQTVAQSYTAHLHHAEYKRLVKQAREAPPKALPEPSSPMSKQAKNRLRAAALKNRQNEALQRVTKPRHTDNDDDDDKDEVADLWSGTSLAPLMARGSQQKRSLVGLEGISSSTKAGLGVRRSHASQKDIREEEEDDLGLDIAQHSASQRNGLTKASSSRVVESKAVAQQIDVRDFPATGQIQRDVVGRKHPPVQPQPAERPVTKRKFFLDFDDGFDAPSNPSKPAIDPRKARSVPLSNGSAISKRKPDKEKEKKSRLEEVPMFII